MTIPKVINQMWFDKKKSNKSRLSIPSKYQAYSDTWKNTNPDFEYRLWNREMIENVFKDKRLERFRSFFYKEIKNHIEKCDFARYAIMFVNGGIYVDLDFKCLKPIAPLIKDKTIGISWEPLSHTNQAEDGGIERRLYNGFLVSAPNQKFWLDFMDWIVRNYKTGKGILERTGPVGFAWFARETELEKKHPDYFLDRCLIIPITAQGPLGDGCSDKTMQNAYCLARGIWMGWNDVGK
jgi:mannosyltransferase OCH1-like enzyme